MCGLRCERSRVWFPCVTLVYGQVARNAELCGSKLYHAQLHPSIPIAICRACFFWSKIIEQDVYLIYRACLVVNQGLKSEIYFTFIPLVSSHHRLKNEACYRFIQLDSSHDVLKNDILTHTIYLTKINFVSLCTSPDKIRATWLRISGDLTVASGDLTGYRDLKSLFRLLSFPCSFK